MSGISIKLASTRLSVVAYYRNVRRAVRAIAGLSELGDVWWYIVHSLCVDNEGVKL